MDCLKISDTSIIAVHRSKRNNESNGIVYRDANGKLHFIDFETCALNYMAEHADSSGLCIGERKLDAYYFIFYTSGIKTKIVFEKMYVLNLFHAHLLSGSKSSRFLTLKNLINQTKYTTYDLS